MDLPTRDILTNPPAFPPTPATTTLFTNPPTTPIQILQTYETPDRILTGICITWTNGDTARLGVCSDDDVSTTGSGMNIGTESKPTTDPDDNHNMDYKINNNNNNKTSDSKNPNTETTPPTSSSPSNNNNNNNNNNPISIPKATPNPSTTTKTFTFDRQERIQIMYIYVSSTQVEGFWFVTNKQKSFFPGRSSERREMNDLGSGVLVGFEGREKRDEVDRVVGVLGLGLFFEDNFPLTLSFAFFFL